MRVLGKIGDLLQLLALLDLMAIECAWRQGANWEHLVAARGIV
jgi:hypothetical protein